MRKFAVIILSHGRAENMVTFKALRRHGYTGDIIVLIDDEDDQADRYRELYGDIVVFNKRGVQVEEGMHVENRQVSLYAREYAWNVASDRGLTHYAVFDDDISFFAYRWQEGQSLRAGQTRQLDGIFEAMCDFIDETGTAVLGMSQTGDFIGGIRTTMWKERLMRKAMNGYVCRVDRRVHYRGYLGEDVISYTTQGSQGVLFFTIAMAEMGQLETQSLDGGITALYREKGTYTKSFFPVMYFPSGVKLGVLDAGAGARIHHNVKWENTVPKILDARWKK